MSSENLNQSHVLQDKGDDFNHDCSLFVHLDDAIFDVMMSPCSTPKILDPELSHIGIRIKSLLKKLHAGQNDETERALHELDESDIDCSAALLYLKASFAFRKRHYEIAQGYAERALKIRPESCQIAHLMGAIAQDQSKNEEAIHWYHAALRIDPSYSFSRMNLAMLKSLLNENDEALRILEEIIKEQPTNYEVIHNYGTVLSRGGQFLKAQKVLEQNIFPTMNFVSSVPGYFYNSLFAEAHITEEIKAKYTQIGRNVAGIFPAKPFNRKQERNKKIKIGYLSGDFRRHSCAFFLEPIIRNHSNEFEVHCLSLTTAKDNITKHFSEVCDQFHNLESFSDEEIFKFVRRLNLDIIIDAIGHTAKARLSLLLQKGAPIQINYLGFAQSTFLPTMDFRIIDNITDPEDTVFHGTEKLLRMPSSFLCFKPILGAPEVMPPPFLKNGYITFGSMNNINKISDSCWEAWSKILARVENAKLLIKSFHLKSETAQNKLKSIAQHFHISANQLLLRGPEDSYDAHLSTYNHVDIALDTFPYAGTTTTCESLLMGTPVVSLLGSSHMSRVGGSILSQVGLSQMASEEPSDYIDKAVFLAHQPDLIGTLKQTLRERLLSSALCDEKAFISNFEKLLHSSLS